MLGVRSQIARMSRCIISKTLIVVVCLGLTVSPGVAADDPYVMVKSGMDKVLQLLKEYPGDMQVARREKIRNVVDEDFDFTEMAKRALGPRWKTASPEKQQEFTRDFSQLIFNVYMRKIEKYANEKIEIDFRRRKIEGEFAVIEAFIVGNLSGKIAVDYYLTHKNGNWKIYDIVIEGIDLALNYRSQFDLILSKSSFDDLLQQMKKKNSQ
jgi:phospholipid transport system substrate-binding protein